MIDSKIKTFTNLKELGDFLKENRELQNIKIEDASKLLLIKKDILDKFEKGEVNIEQASYLKGFLNSYIKFLKLDNLCKLKFTETKRISKLEKSNLTYNQAQEVFKEISPKYKNLKRINDIFLNYYQLLYYKYYHHLMG